MSARAAAEPGVDRRAFATRFRLVALAEASFFALILGLALVVRLAGLADPTDLPDEGTRGVQLRLLAAGFRPVSEIYASQGPLSLWLFYPAVALFGPDILVGRLTVVAASLIVLVAGVWIGRRLGGPVVGLMTGLVLAVSPLFLAYSRQALVEMPSIAPTVLGLVVLVLFRQHRRRRWLIVSAALFALGALAKPMAAVAGLAALILLLAPDIEAPDGPLRGPRSWHDRLVDLGLFTLTGGLICASVVLAVGATELYEQVVAYRLGARQVHGWELAANSRRIVEHLQLNGWGVLLAAALGCAVVARDRQPLGVALVVWLGGGLVALLLYSPLWDKHVTYILPPLAVLAGLGFASALPLAARRWDRPQLAFGLTAVVALGLVVTSLPRLAGEAHAFVYRHDVSDISRYADDLLIVSAATSPSDFVVVDDAYLGMMTGRMAPPPLADLSWGRIRAQALTAEQAIDATRRFASRILIVQHDHLGRLRGYLTWADREYVLVKSYAQRRPARFRRVYAHPDVELGAVGEALRASLATPTDVRIGPVRLLGYELERREVKLGSRVDLTVMLEAIEDRPPDHDLVTRLRDRSGRTAWESEWRVGDGGQELHSWRTGRWQARALSLIVTNVPVGRYSLTVALRRPNGKAAAVTPIDGAPAWATGDEVDLGEVLVVR